MFVVLHMCNYLVSKSTDQLKRSPKYSVGTVFAMIKMMIVTNVLTAPSMFGRDLGDQVRADSKDDERQVPIIVEKCIQAVEFRGSLGFLAEIRRIQYQINSIGL